MTSTIHSKEIRLKDIVEVFQDYKKSALLLCCISCDWKCCIEAGIDVSVCQNHNIIKQREVYLPFDVILNKVNLSITDSIIFGGLEPLLQSDEVCGLIEYLREQGVKKDILVYTGYYIEEIDKEVIKRLKNCHVILKCGRYIPNKPKKFDKILGITLASDNQYSVQL